HELRDRKNRWRFRVRVGQSGAVASDTVGRRPRDDRMTRAEIDADDHGAKNRASVGARVPASLEIGAADLRAGKDARRRAHLAAWRGVAVHSARERRTLRGNRMAGRPVKPRSSGLLRARRSLRCSNPPKSSGGAAMKKSKKR